MENLYCKKCGGYGDGGCICDELEKFNSDMEKLNHDIEKNEKELEVELL